MPPKKRSSAGKPSLKVRNKSKTKATPQKIKPGQKTKPEPKNGAVVAPKKKKDAKVGVLISNQLQTQISMLILIL
jgi:hypothetical protein